MTLAISDISPAPLKASQLVALAQFGVTWLPARERPRIAHYFDMRNQPLDFIAKVGFGEPASATSISLFYLKREHPDEAGELCEVEVPISNREEYQRVYNELKEARAADRNDSEWKQGNKELKDRLPPGAFMEESLQPITPVNFALSPLRTLVVHEGEGKYAIHVCFKGEVHTTTVQGSPDDVVKTAKRWFFEKHAVPVLVDWVKEREGEPKTVFMTDSLEAVPDVLLDPVTADPIHGRVAIWPILEDGEVALCHYLPGFREPIISGEPSLSPPRIMMRLEKDIREALRNQAWLAKTSPKLREAFPDNLAPPAQTVTPSDFEGKHPCHFLVQAQENGSWKVYFCEKGARTLVHKEFPKGDERAATELVSGIRRFVFKERMDPYVSSQVSKIGPSVFWTRGDFSLERRHFFEESQFDVGRIVLRPNRENYSFEAFFLNPETAEPESVTIPFGEVCRFEERVEALCAELFGRFFTALENLRGHLGARCLEAFESIPPLGPEDYRVRVCPEQLKVELIYGKASQRNTLGFSPNKVDALVQEALEERQRAAAFLTAIKGVPDATVVPHLKNVRRKHFISRAPQHVIVKATKDYTAFTIFHTDAYGEGVSCQGCSRPEHISEVVKGIREKLALVVNLNTTGLGKIGQIKAYEIPPAPEGVLYGDLVSLCRRLQKKARWSAVPFSSIDLSLMKRRLKRFVRELGDYENFRDRHGDPRKQLVDNLRTMVCHIVAGLQNKSDHHLTYEVLHSLAEASENCRGRWHAAINQEYLNVQDRWDQQFAGSWEQLVHAWIDELKVGIGTKMAAETGSNHNMHTRNYFLHSLHQAGIKIPPVPDVDLDDPNLTYRKGGYEPSQVVMQFKRRFGEAVVDFIGEKANPVLVQDQGFCAQALDALRGYADKYLATDEDREKFEGAKRGAESADLADQKCGILQNRLFEAGLVEWQDDTFSHIRLTPDGTKALLHQLQVINLPVMRQPLCASRAS